MTPQWHKPQLQVCPNFQSDVQLLEITHVQIIAFQVTKHGDLRTISQIA